MEVVNDSRLLELAREPAIELFPAARRDSMAQPLILILAFMPGLMVFWNQSLDEAACRQGLLALDVIVSERPLGWFATANQKLPSDGQGLAFPLTTLLTALGLQVKILTPMSRLHLVSYLCSAVLLLSLSGLAKKVGGCRFALAVVCLACGHREFLTLSESLPPVTLPLAFAVLAFWAMLVHRSRDEAWMTWPLVGSGVALAACWLSGGALALASWSVLMLASVTSIIQKRERTKKGSWSHTLQQHVAKASMISVNVVVMTLVAVSIVAGWETVFSVKTGLSIILDDSWWTGTIWPNELRAIDAAQALIQMNGPWLGFMILGVTRLTRGRTSKRDRLAGETRGLFVCWSVVSATCWLASWPVHRGDWTHSVNWEGFLLLPVLTLAAFGLEGVLRREYNLGSVLMVTLGTFAIVFMPDLTSRFPNPLSGSWIASSVLVVVLLVSSGWFAAGKVVASDCRNRLVLSTCVAALLLTDASIGAFSRPRLADDERELLAFRQKLLKEGQPNECWLITDEAAPVRLRFLLRSLWLGVPLREAHDWESVLAMGSRKSVGQTHDNSLVGTDHRTRNLIVTWGSSKYPTDDLRRRGQVLTQTTGAHYFQARLLKSYRWIERTETATSR